MNDNETTTAFARDPIRDEDVEIECRPVHRRTDYESIDGEELPVLTDSDFRHDPVEGCQGSYTMISEIEGGCPNCGYDRSDVSINTMGGIRHEACRACNVDITDRHRDDWSPSRQISNAERTKHDGDYLGKAGDVTVYARNALPDSIALHRNNNVMYLRNEDVFRLAEIAARKGYDAEEDPLPLRLTHPVLTAFAQTTATDDGGDD